MLRRCCPLAYQLVKPPQISNEHMNHYTPGSVEATAALAACTRIRSEVKDCPIIIGGKRYTTPHTFRRVIPSDHGVTVAKGYNATAELAQKAVATALEASKSWSQMPFRDRAAIFLKAAHLISTKYRYELLATTMLGQSKNPWQAEIDSIAEAADFFRWGVHFAEGIYKEQPFSGPGVWNSTDYRPTEGFWTAITPFNFTAIAANLAGAPALMGNVVVWKPSPHALLSNFVMMEVLEEAGLPPGVINFLPCDPAVMDANVNANENLAGVIFTGSSKVFTEINKNVYGRLDNYRSFPRISGETGGKDFHLIHPSADLQVVAAATLRGAFEYQGQKCSACSRLYAPKSTWHELKALLLKGLCQIKLGQPDDLQSFMCAVIDETAFTKIKGYVDMAKADPGEYTILAGGTCDRTTGYFIHPTIVESKSPTSKLMTEEIFGPVLSVNVYDDSKPGFWREVCDLIDTSTQYSLTGSVFSNDRVSIREASQYLRYAAGNFYINDKCTGAVVGQQPFGGARRSGTNDKPVTAQFLYRFVSARSIKENFDVQANVSYPHQLPDVYTL